MLVYESVEHQVLPYLERLPMHVHFTVLQCVMEAVVLQLDQPVYNPNPCTLTLTEIVYSMYEDDEDNFDLTPTQYDVVCELFTHLYRHFAQATITPSYEMVSVDAKFFNMIIFELDETKPGGARSYPPSNHPLFL